MCRQGESKIESAEEDQLDKLFGAVFVVLQEMVRIFLKCGYSFHFHIYDKIAFGESVR